VRFERCSVADDRLRDFFSTGSSASHRNRGGLADIHGSFTVANPFGCTYSLGANPVGVDVQVVSCINSSSTSVRRWRSESGKGRE